MKYLSVCSGVEAASVAWKDLGWEAVGFSEIEPFPSAVLKHHYPNITNFGDMTKYKEWNINEPVDIIVGGTPCQSFSIAGLRKGLEDERGNLMLVYVRMLEHFKPKWFVWENVPGVLSSNGGKDFSTFLGALAELGYGFAYRVLDAKNFGVPQRRRRVFVVGHLGDWRPPAQVLFESESVCRDTQTCGDSGKNTTAYVGAGTQAYGIPGNWIGRKPKNGGNATEPMHDIAPCLTKTDQHAVSYTDKKVSYTDNKGYAKKVNYVDNKVAYRKLSLTSYKADESASTVCSRDHKSVTDIVLNNIGLNSQSVVRRLTPVECERLQGFHDNYTNIPWRGKETASDAPRYKAMGNSMAVPVMRWIGNRVNYVDKKINYVDQFLMN
jgi:DNA (cytosine-5)-methyltransferase 1